MTRRLLLDEHYSEAIASALRDRGHDVISVVADPQLRGASDPEVYRSAATDSRRIVTENIKDFRPLLMDAIATGAPTAAVLLVHPRRFPRGHGSRAAAIIEALDGWLSAADVDTRPAEDWLA